VIHSAALSFKDFSAVMAERSAFRKEIKKSFVKKQAYSLAKVAKIEIKTNFPVQRRWQLNFHNKAKCTKQNTWRNRSIHTTFRE
jgi:hypothetical protein